MLGQFVKLSCIHNRQELNPSFSDLILFPEYSQHSEIKATSLEFPRSVVAGAYKCGGSSIGAIYFSGRPVLEYRKVEPDNVTKGSGDSTQNTICELGAVCFGILVCKDVNSVDIMRRTIDAMMASGKERRVLFVPGAMGDYWFGSDVVASDLHGINVVLCNHIKSHQARCKSFVTDTNGRKLVIQTDGEPIYADLP